MDELEEFKTGLIISCCVVVIIALAVGFFGSWYIIGAGERGVLLTFGKPSMNAMGEGLHFKIPVVQGVAKLDVKTQKYEVDADSVTKDLQSVNTKIALNYHLNPEATPKLYQEIGLDYRARIIEPAIQEAVKAVMAKYKIEELTDRRPEISMGAKSLLSEKLGKYHVSVDDFNIVNFDWSEEFKKNIENKLIAEQKKLTAERDLDRIRIEADQKVVQAEAEAESIKIQSEALKQSNDVLELRWIEKWDGIMPTTYVAGSDTNTLLSIPA